MLPVDDKQLRIMMKKMGINLKELKADRVIIEAGDKQYVFENPSVTIMEMKGQKTYQVVGEPKIKMRINEEDVELVMEKTGKSREEAIKALEEAKGDIAQAILNLSS
ncbi:MAG TPA: nascent polypeptide-associated complex protein [Thermoplasmatales archaeon]|nr:nascent polypeptide-associated complex protein [Thermoplasmatales archaeon]